MAEPTLRPGSGGETVRQLQQALQGLGYDPGAIDGHFGSQTESAVKAFQGAQGITVDGVVGEITWLNIDEADMSNPTIRRGSTGNPVRRAQKRLTLGGYDTAWRRRRLRRWHGGSGHALPGRSRLTVDGIVGPRTWAEIDALGD